VDYRCSNDNSMGTGAGDNNTMGGFIHVLLVIAIVVVLVRIIQGRSPF